MKIRPIPKELLPNSCTYQKYNLNTGEGSSYSSPVTLSFVKIDEEKQFSYTNNGKEVIGNGIMFYDLVNSEGLTSEPTNESIIIFNNKKYTIKDLDILRAKDKTPHHYEILLK